MRTTNRPASGTVQSVDRAVTILELLAVHGTAGVTQLARERPLMLDRSAHGLQARVGISNDLANGHRG